MIHQALVLGFCMPWDKQLDECFTVVAALNELSKLGRNPIMSIQQMGN
jgi:hypothetical protein